MSSYIYAPFLPNFSLRVLNPHFLVCGFLLYTNQARFEETRRARWSLLIFSQLATQCCMEILAAGGDRGRYHLQNEEQWKIFFQIYVRVSISYHSDFFISWIQRLFSSTRLNCLVQNLICQTQVSNAVDRLYSLYLLKHHKSKLKTQLKKQLHVSEVTGCCFILSFHGLEVCKGFINGIVSTIIR